MPATLPTNLAFDEIITEAWVDAVRACLVELQAGGVGGGGAASLTPTAVKTAAYTAVASDFIPVDATSAAITITLPTAPAAKTSIAVKKIDATANLVTVVRGGSDVFDATGGVTSTSLSFIGETCTLQYATGIWYVTGNARPRASLSTLSDFPVTAAVAYDVPYRNAGNNGWINGGIEEIPAMITLASRVSVNETNVAALNPNLGGMVGKTHSLTTKAENTLTQAQMGRKLADVTIPLQVDDVHMFEFIGAIRNLSASPANLSSIFTFTPNDGATPGVRATLHSYPTISIPADLGGVYPVRFTVLVSIGPTQTTHSQTSELWIGTAQTPTTGGSTGMSGSAPSTDFYRGSLNSASTTSDIGSTCPLWEFRTTWGSVGGVGTEIGIYQHVTRTTIQKA